MAVLKLTPSEDGIDRASVSVRLRFTREEIELMVFAARKEGISLQDWIYAAADCGVDDAMAEYING